MARLYLFDDKRSVFHAVLGFIAAGLLLYGIIILLVYTVYEVREPERPVATVGDMVEFMIGYVAGLAVLIARLMGWW